MSNVPDLVLHLTACHPDEESSIHSPNDVGTHLITTLGDPASAITTLAKVLKAKDPQQVVDTLGDLAQVLQRLAFTGLKKGDARERVLGLAAKFLVSLAGNADRSSPFTIPSERRYAPVGTEPGSPLALTPGFKKKHDKTNGPLMVAAVASTSQSQESELQDPLSPLSQQSAGRVILEPGSSYEELISTPSDHGLRSTPRAAREFETSSDVDLVALLKELFSMTGSSKSLLAEVVKEIPDVNRYVFTKHLDDLRPFLDFHIQSLSLLAGITGATMQCVIRQLNSCVAELFGSHASILTPYDDLEPHPFLEQLYQGATASTDRLFNRHTLMTTTDRHTLMATTSTHTQDNNIQTHTHGNNRQTDTRGNHNNNNRHTLMTTTDRHTLMATTSTDTHDNNIQTHTHDKNRQTDTRGNHNNNNRHTLMTKTDRQTHTHGNNRQTHTHDNKQTDRHTLMATTDTHSWQQQTHSHLQSYHPPLLPPSLEMICFVHISLADDDDDDAIRIDN